MYHFWGVRGEWGGEIFGAGKFFIHLYGCALCYSEKRFTQSYGTFYGNAMLVATNMGTNMAAVK